MPNQPVATSVESVVNHPNQENLGIATGEFNSVIEEPEMFEQTVAVDDAQMKKYQGWFISNNN